MKESAGEVGKGIWVKRALAYVVVEIWLLPLALLTVNPSTGMWVYRLIALMWDH